MSVIFKWAVRELDEVTHDPTAGVDHLRIKSDGFRPWTPADIAKYRERWPLGTRERLAFELLFHTGLRRSDVVRLGPGHIDENVISIATHKTGEMAYIAVSPDLEAVLAASPLGSETFLVTGYDLPFSSAGFGNWFRKKCNAAGLRHVSAHGLRKSAAEEVAEGGATDHELMSMFGWTNPAQAATYTRAASRKQMAKSAGSKRRTNKKS
jgi:integrase